MLLFESTTLEIFLLFLLIVYYYIRCYFTKTFNHWKDKGIIYEQPTAFFGNTRSNVLGFTHAAFDIRRLYDKFPDERFVGIFMSRKPALLIRDPELIKRITVQDFHHFPNRGGVAQFHKLEPLGKHLFNLEGQRWRTARKTLSGTFSSVKMKFMFNLLAECAEEFNEYLHDCSNMRMLFEMREICGNFTSQVIGSCVFGVRNDSIRNPSSKFRIIGKELTDPNFVTAMKRKLRSYVPKLYKILKLKTTTKEWEQFFLNIANDVVEHREQNDISRKDFIQLLIDLKNSDENKEIKNVDDVTIDNNFIAAQLYLFYVAGYETSASTMSFCLYELALHPEVQTKTQSEIDEVLKRHGGELTFEAISEMTYFEKVMSEVLRKFPAAGFLERSCAIPYTIPDTKITLDVGESIVIPQYAIQNDARHFPNPERFDPERFTEECKKTRHACSYIPFGEGPRLCIGMRFAKYQMYAGLVALLKDFSVHPFEKTEIPMTFTGSSPVLQAKNGVWLEIKKRNTIKT